jgi:hypothetical protein
VRFLYTPGGRPIGRDMVEEDDLAVPKKGLPVQRGSVRTLHGRVQYMTVDRGQGGAVQGYLGTWVTWGCVTFGLGLTRRVDVTQVRRYIGTLAPSERTRSCKSCAHSPSIHHHQSRGPLVGVGGRQG